MKILLTGGSRGIGKAIADKFAKEGHEIYAPTREELDLNDNLSVEQYIKTNEHIGFDVIINNAGINDINEIQDITDDEIANMIQINLVAPIKLIRGFVGAMKEQRFGRIVNIGSIWGVVSKGGRCVYSATKNGIHGVTNTLAVELAPYNILVNTVCPGFTMTELTKKNNDEKQIEKIESEIPLGRMAQPEEIANIVYMICSKENTYMTGQKIVVDGGFSEK